MIGRAAPADRSTHSYSSPNSRSCCPTYPDISCEVVDPHHPARILFVFVDGVGLGPSDEINPLSTLALPSFAELAGGQPWTEEASTVDMPDHVFRAIDANLAVAGLPQSGTGQASLFTGVNCAEIVGRHFGPYPHSATRPVLAEHNVLLQVQSLFPDIEEPAIFANAYPPRFFEYARRRDRWTVTTRCCLDADVRLRTTRDVQRRQALTAEITGRAWREQLGIDVPQLEERQAGAHLVTLARDAQFTLFEYYLTDKAGHGRLGDPASVLRSLDRFLGGVLSTLDPSRELLVVTSDHGNIEDLSVKTHTRHPVPLVAYGAGARLLGDVADLTGVTPAVVQALASGALLQE